MFGELSFKLPGVANTNDVSNTWITSAPNLAIVGTITTGVWNGTAISLSSYASGTLQAAQFPALTGNVTTSGGSLTTTIAAGVVTEAMQVLANNTTNNVSTSKHGYAPIAPNDATKYLDGTGSYSVPATSTGLCAQRVSTETGAVATGTTAFTQNDVIPTNTNGDQYMTLAITPKNTANVLVIEAVSLVTSSNVDLQVVALFQDSTANALAVAKSFSSTSTGGNTIFLRHVMTAGTTSSTTFKIRIGTVTAGHTITFNGSNSVREFGGKCASSMMITEYTS